MPTKEAINIKKTLPTQIWSSNQVKKEETGAARPPPVLVQRTQSPRYWIFGFFLFFFKFISNIQKKGFKVDQSKEDKLKLVIKAFY